MIESGFEKQEFEIRLATERDVTAIRAWLRSDRGGSVFCGNWSMIEGGQATGYLSVLCGVNDNQVVGFLLSTDSSLDIMEIRPSFRRAGLGRMLAQHGLSRIERSGQFGVLIECAPHTSIPFWKKLGFHPIEWEHDADRGNHLAFEFRRYCELPADQRVNRVRVELLPPPVCHGCAPKEFIRHAILIEDGKLLLDGRIATFVDNGDVVVKVQVDDETISEKKAKYSRDVGVEYEKGFIRLDDVYC